MIAHLMMARGSLLSFLLSISVIIQVGLLGAPEDDPPFMPAVPLPAASPQQTTPSDDVLVPPVIFDDAPATPKSERERAKIEATIRRALENPGAVEATGDPILDSVLEAARERSIDRPEDVLSELLPHEAVSDEQSLEPPSLNVIEVSPAPAGVNRSTRLDDERFLVAEQLLRTARMLAKLQPEGTDASRTELIRQMRAEAAQLLAPERGL